MDYEDIIKKLSNKVYHPIYFLMGEEPYYIDLISDYIEQNILDSAEKEFNQSVIYGKDIDVAGIISCAKRFPMMANYQVVIVKEAQDIKKIEELQIYIENPLKSTILVLCYKYGKIDKRKTFAKTLEKTAVLFESQKIYDNQVPAWIGSYLKKKNYTIQTKAASLLAEYLGTDLSRIVNEISKLIINIPAGTEITPEHIEQNIGISKDYNVFELTKALGQKDFLKTHRIILHFSQNERDYPITMVIAILYSFFVKLLLYHYVDDKSSNNVASVLSIKPFFVGDYSKAATKYSKARLIHIISLLRTYDLKSKGVDNISASGGELLKELTFKILN
jgi:DNA polymerase III subunit delta